MWETLTCAGAFQRQVFGDPSEVLAPKTFGVAVTFLVGPSVSSTVELYLSCKNQFFQRWSPVSGKASVSCVAAVLVRPFLLWFFSCWLLGLEVAETQKSTPAETRLRDEVT